MSMGGVRSCAVLLVGFTIVMGGLKTDARGESTWTEDVKLTADNIKADMALGWAVSVSGSTAMAGAPYEGPFYLSEHGAVYVFEDNGLGWNQTQKLLASDADFGDLFGYSLALDGSTAVIGAQGEADCGSRAGAAYVFQKSGSTWSEAAKLKASQAEAGDEFGWSVGIDDGTIIVGARDPYYDPGVNSGDAYIFEPVGGTWTQTAKLTPSDPVSNMEFGFDVGISGSRAIVGAILDSEAALSAGAAYIFEDNGTAWNQVAKLTVGDARRGQQVGWSVAIQGDLAVVGVPADNDMGESSGAAYVFEWDGLNWNEADKLIAWDALAFAYFGQDVAIDDNALVVGAYREGEDLAGAAYLFERSPDGMSWDPVAKLIESDTALPGTPEEYVGYSVSISGETVLVGAPYNDNPDMVRPGDSDNDGRIDGGDLAEWQKYYDPLGASNNTYAMGDWNGDGKIDGGDLAIWQQNYDPLGTISSGAALVYEDVLGSEGACETPLQPIPEPGTLLLVGTSLVAILGATRRRGRT